MSDHARFILLVGTGHPYGGEGLSATDMLSLHGDKGGWYGQTEDGCFYWRNSSFEDALLMVSLFFVSRQISENIDTEHSFDQLRRQAEAFFQVSLFETGLDTRNRHHIKKRDLETLYLANQKTLSCSNVKLVGVRLDPHSRVRHGKDQLAEEFLQVVDRYTMHNVELCTSIYGRFYGSFDQQMREYRGKVLPES